MVGGLVSCELDVLLAQLMIAGAAKAVQQTPLYGRLDLGNRKSTSVFDNERGRVGETAEGA